MRHPRQIRTTRKTKIILNRPSDMGGNGVRYLFLSSISCAFCGTTQRAERGAKQPTRRPERGWRKSLVRGFWAVCSSCKIGRWLWKPASVLTLTAQFYPQGLKRLRIYDECG